MSLASWLNRLWLAVLLTLLRQQGSGADGAYNMSQLIFNTTMSSNMTSSNIGSDPSKHPHFNAHTCGIRNINTSHGEPPIRPFRLLMTTSDKYLPVLLNWLIFFHELCPDQSALYFVCLDKATEGVMKKVGLSCHHTFHTPTSESKNKLWLLRARLTKALLDEGRDVLLSDSDAIWLQNPFDVLEMFPESDIIGSRGSFPEDAAKILGATLCMGFVYVKSNPKTRHYWGQLVDYMVREAKPDDQRNFNHLLLARGVFFPSAHLPLPYLNSKVHDTGHVVLSGPRRVELPRDANRTLQLTLLPHNQFRRICEKELLSIIHEAHVAHCYSYLKTGTGKRGAEAKYGLWALREAWERVSYPAPPAGADEYYRLIAEDVPADASPARSPALPALPASSKVAQSRTPSSLQGTHSRALLEVRRGAAAAAAAAVGGRGSQQHGQQLPRRHRTRFALLCRPEKRSLNATRAPVPAWCHERGRAFARDITAADVAAMEGRGERLPLRAEEKNVTKTLSL